ncbi:MAG: rhodanese-like domain-containing protein, partial [Verrucomicrobiales bacterium]
MPKTITATELGNLLTKDPSLNIIDVRTSAEHEEVHIAGVTLHPLDKLDPWKAIQDVRAADPLYIVCRTGNRACKAIKKLEATGFNNAVVLEGGIQAWEAENLPVVRGMKVMSLERQVRIAAGSLVVVGAILGFVTGTPYWHGLSAFVGAGLLFAGITDTCGMGMLMT